MSEKTNKQQPLLYILQPEFVTPQAPMQQSYSLKKTIKNQQVVKEESKSDPTSADRNEDEIEELGVESGYGKDIKDKNEIEVNISKKVSEEEQGLEEELDKLILGEAVDSSRKEEVSQAVDTIEKEEVSKKVINNKKEEVSHAFETIEKEEVSEVVNNKKEEVSQAIETIEKEEVSKNVINKKEEANKAVNAKQKEEVTEAVVAEQVKTDQSDRIEAEVMKEGENKEILQTSKEEKLDINVKLKNEDKLNEKQDKVDVVQTGIKEEQNETINRENNEKKEKKQGRSVKRFKEMDLNERIIYLTKIPRHLPSVACEFKTSQKAYRGFLVGKSDDAISIRLYNNKKKTIQINEIEEIKMIGY